VMVKLGTDLADPADRLQAVHDSMADGKRALAQMTPMQILAMSALGQAPAILGPMLKMSGLVKPPYNLIISNVPGPRTTQYFNGMKLEGTYPLSIPIDGMALNITCNSYADQMAFGLTGCRGPSLTSSVSCSTSTPSWTPWSRPPGSPERAGGQEYSCVMIASKARSGRTRRAPMIVPAPRPDGVARLRPAGGGRLDDLLRDGVGAAGRHRLVGLLHARADLLRLVLVRRTAADVDQALAGDGVPLGPDRAGLDDHDPDAVRRELEAQAVAEPSTANFVAWYQAPSGS